MIPCGQIEVAGVEPASRWELPAGATLIRCTLGRRFQNADGTTEHPGIGTSSFGRVRRIGPAAQSVTVSSSRRWWLELILAGHHRHRRKIAPAQRSGPVKWCMTATEFIAARHSIPFGFFQSVQPVQRIKMKKVFRSSGAAFDTESAVESALHSSAATAKLVISGHSYGLSSCGGQVALEPEPRVRGKERRSELFAVAGRDQNRLNGESNSGNYSNATA